MNTISCFLVAVLVVPALLPHGAARDLNEKPKSSEEEGAATTPNNWGWPGTGYIPDPGRFFGPGNNWGGGYGVGYSGPNGGYNKGGIVRPSVVCSGKGTCYKKRLTCPAKCFTYYSRSGRNYGGGGGGGGCSFDCENNCVAYC